jgi:PAS domain S-box-containing protein
MQQSVTNGPVSEAHLRAVIGTAVDGIIIIDERGIVRLYNAACERLFGYQEDEVVGRNVSMLMPAHYRFEHDGYLRAYLETGQPRVIGIGREVTGQRKDGSQFPIGLSVGESWHNRGRFFVGIVRDITEQKYAEEKLRKAKEEAEAANRTKSDFLAVMSHEIRSPLHGILATISLLSHTALDEKQARYAETIRQSGEVLLEVVNDILDLSKIEAGCISLKEKRFDVRDLLESIESLWESRVRAKALNYYSSVDTDVPHGLIGDADRIREVLNNLVDNAVKFTEHGYIAVKIEVDGCNDGMAVLRFEVKDTGIGIEKKFQSRLFERFEQGDVSLTRKHGGSGLGLTICREMCHLLGGEIGVTSEPGEGSVFWFTVSCRPADDAAPHVGVRPFVPAAADDGADQNKLTVLIADDNETNQVIIRDILEYHGHGVDIALNGPEAVRAATRKHYDVIFMDVGMPLMDGLQATRQIRKNLPGFSKVPIIALTAHAMNGDRERCLAAGMDDYISKPFTIGQINEIVEKHTRVSLIES